MQIINTNLLRFKQNNPTSIVGTFHYHFQGYNVSRCKLEFGQSTVQSQWSVCIDVQTGFALHLSQKLITFGSSRNWVKCPEKKIGGSKLKAWQVHYTNLTVTVKQVQDSLTKHKTFIIKNIAGCIQVELFSTNHLKDINNTEG